jgi:hypothetical protein
MNTAVLFLIFNRPETTRRVLEAIRAARPRRLYVAADEPRASHEDDVWRREESRKATTGVDWPCEVKTLFQDTNSGCNLGWMAAGAGESIMRHCQEVQQRPRQ